MLASEYNTATEIVITPEIQLPTMGLDKTELVSNQSWISKRLRELHSSLIIYWLTVYAVREEVIFLSCYIT